MKWLGDGGYEIDCQTLETRDSVEAEERFPIAVITKSPPVVEEEWVETLYRSQGKVTLTYVVAKVAGQDIYFLCFP